MIKFNYCHLMRGLLSATALALGLLAAGATPAYAAVVIVTGGNGAFGSYTQPAGAGRPATADAGNRIPNSDPSNSATSTGGNGGAASQIPTGSIYRTGGAGGAATSTATTNRTTGSASAIASAIGGAGGNGGPSTTIFFPPGNGGNGGQATATSSAADSSSGTTTSSAIANGGSGGAGGTEGFGRMHRTGLNGSGGKATATASGQSTGGGAVDVTASATGGSVAAGGLATATASGQSTGSGAVDLTASATGGSGGAAGAAKAYATGVAIRGSVQANASANGGAGVIPGAAFAQSDAKNASGEVLTTASAPGASAPGGPGTPQSALTSAGVGSGSVTLAAAFTAGQAVSDAIRTPGGGLTIGVGAISAAYGGLGGLEYTATAVFDFSTTAKSEALDLKVLADKAAGIGFDSLELKVSDDGTTLLDKSFSSLTGSKGAETFFAPGQSISLGAIAAGSQSVTIEYLLGYKSGTLATAPAGFGFTYDLVDPRSSSAIPEPSTWAMLLIGFAGLAYASYRASENALLAGNGGGRHEN